MKALRWPPWSFGSGPSVGALASRLLALIALAAWLSLGSQVRVLLGSRGLLPVGELMDAVRADGRVGLLDLPTLFWRFHSDGVLVGGTIVGAALSIMALCGWRPRLCFALSTALYLSYATVGRDFLSFQWDNLLLECGLLAAFLPTLPTDRPAPLVHFLFRLVLFKLYFESGIAKWQSDVGDWQDGSAMTYYYETAPLPTWLAFTAHHLPVWWHHLESRATLVLELVVPFLIFGPRRARLFAAFAFSFFQICNAATANYGFFCYLAAALNVFLLDDVDVERAGARAAKYVPSGVRRGVERLLSFRARPASAPREKNFTPKPSLWIGRAAAALFVLVSLTGALFAFTEPGRALTVAAPLFELNQRFRLVNSYHLFAAITRERIEPELQTLVEGQPLDSAGDDAEPRDPVEEDRRWTPQYLWHKPGDPRRAPDFVAPHQPRVDFQLWFYGLTFRRREPTYVSTLVERMCEDPPAVQPLFREPLPPHPAAVRIVYWRYVFASRAERRATGAWWSRARLAAMSRPVVCSGGNR
jgi:lipase maturation factor 1